MNLKELSKFNQWCNDNFYTITCNGVIDGPFPDSALEFAWREARSELERENARLREALGRVDTLLDLIEEHHYVSEENTDNMPYYGWEEMWKGLRKEFDIIARQALAENGR